MNKVPKIILLVLILSSNLFPLITFAQGQGEFLPCVGSNCKLVDLIQFIKNVITFFLRIAIPLGIAFVIYGAFVIMTAGGAEERVKEGRKIITYALIGIAVVFASWLIVTTFVKILGGVQSL